MLYSNYASASPADIQRKREIQQRLLMQAQQTQPQNIGEGLGAVGDYIYAGRLGKVVDAGDKDLRGKGNAILQSLLGGGMQQEQPSTPESMSPQGVNVAQIAPPPDMPPSTNPGAAPQVAPMQPQMPQQQRMPQADNNGRFMFPDVETERLQELVSDPNVNQVLDYIGAGSVVKQAQEELDRRIKWQQGGQDRTIKGLQIQKMERDLNAGPDAPTVQKITQSDGSEVLVQWNGKEWVPLNAPQGGRSVGDYKKLTESQSKLTLFQSLQTETQPFLLDMEQQFDPSNVPDAAARLLPGGNFWASQDAQMYDSAATAWAEGALRIATGAAATPEEMERTKRAYFAQPGDNPQTVKFKAQMRDMYQRSIQRALGQTNVPGSLPSPADFAKQVSGKNNSLPQGVTEEDVEFTMKKHGLTREQVLERLR